VIQLYEVSILTGLTPIVQIIETEKELFMIMENANGGELFDYIVRHTRLAEKQAAKFYCELIAGIEYLHKSGMCHRDLKPENLLLDFDNTLKIVDFGLSNMYEKNETLKTACGSPCYAAPEVRIQFWPYLIAFRVGKLPTNSDGFFLMQLINFVFS
jgi:5'-AMP-activated protein kinase catalytic alpha subunit